MTDLDPQDRQALKTWIREERKRRGLSQETLAVMVGVDVKTIKNAEREGGHLPQALTMARLLRALGEAPDAPISLPGANGLEELQAGVAELAQRMLASSDREQRALQLLEELGTRLQRIEEQRELGRDEAQEGP